MNRFGNEAVFLFHAVWKCCNFRFEFKSGIMRKLVVGIVLTGIFGACKNKEEVKVLNVPVRVEAESIECYKGIFKNDTISMFLKLKGHQVTDGQLQYCLFEKDKNDGTLAGEIKGDTLFAIYTFKSEGMTSKREVAFLKNGQTYTEGFGETTVDPEGNPIFKNPQQLKFDGKIVLTKTDCQ